ncbi:hypothetical protein NS506_04391 [Nocardia seriolae]|uniref:Uncharacterized protein n=1 Tax=Nocardia seriolae TaxID=37332 RepID=A0ABC8AW95_9NOCA|nr:hypothetical protein NS506_04391 [Nocardia seriolae]
MDVEAMRSARGDRRVDLGAGSRPALGSRETR